MCRDSIVRPRIYMACEYFDQHALWKSLCCLIFLGLFRSAMAGRGFRLSNELDEDFQYDHNLTEILVEYASVVYVNDLDSLISWNCTRCNGHTKGFKMTELVVDVQHCLQAYVGLAEDLNAIVVAFRGTQENSIQNWMEDLYFKQLDLKYPGVTGAMVHRGFYTAYHNTTLRPRIIAAIMAIRAEVEGLKIMVTGHSMGGAMAAFCSLDLAANYRIDDIQTITFGQPRIGNSVFASYYSALLPNTYRMTHNHDMVPHLPPYYSLFPQRSYHHFGKEIWIYKDGTNESIRICDDSGEDPNCSRSVSGNSIADHLCYLGVFLQAETWSTCSFILQNNVSGVTSGGFFIRLPLARERSIIGDGRWQLL